MTKHESRLGTEDFGVESSDSALVGDGPTKSVDDAPKFPLLSILELEEQPEPEFLIEDILMVDSQAILVAPPAEGKSFLALSFALCVATGREWLGHKVKQGLVVYVAAEGGRGMRKRVRAWMKEHDIRTVDSMFFLLEAPQLRSGEQLRELLKSIEAKLSGYPVLIVLDTLARTMVGADENTAKEVGEWVDGAQKLQKKTGATILTLHHSLKRQGKSKPIVERGSGALRGAVDTMMVVVKKGSNLTLSCEKSKDSEEFEDIPLLLKQVDLGASEKGPQSSLVVVRGDASVKMTIPFLGEGPRMALSLLRDLAGPHASKKECEAPLGK